MQETDIQRQIRESVTGGREYDRDSTSRIPLGLRNTAFGVQVALANMEFPNSRIYQCADMCARIMAMVAKFDKAGIPLNVITDAEGFRRAYDSAYGSLDIRKVYAMDGLKILKEKYSISEAGAFKDIKTFSGINNILKNEPYLVKNFGLEKNSRKFHQRV